MSLVEQELPSLPEYLNSSPVVSGVRVTRSLVLCVCMFCRSLSVLRFTDSDYIFGIFKLFLKSLQKVYDGHRVTSWLLRNIHFLNGNEPFAFYLDFSYLYHWQDIYQILPCITRQVSNKKWKFLTIRRHIISLIESYCLQWSYWIKGS